MLYTLSGPANKRNYIRKSLCKCIIMIFIWLSCAEFASNNDVIMSLFVLICALFSWSHYCIHDREDEIETELQ